jgi:low temperature requirement protein LtrA
MHRSPTSLLRAPGPDRGRVGMVELFFDLVFVFAITQLSHALLAQLDGPGALRIGLIGVAIWWVWIYTSWFTNWLDPERTPVRSALFALMGAGLVMSAAVPRAFDDRGLAFAAAYVGMQLGRTLFFIWAVRAEPPAMRRNFQRIAVWLALAGIFWIGGALADPAQRLGWWALALGIEFVSPALYFRVPGLGRSQLSDWNVDGGHLAERCALFIIIALGESLLISGATFANAAWEPTIVAAFAATAIGAIAMWWLYFDRGLPDGHHHIAAAEAPGRHARAAYTYLHLPIVAGIVLCAVADELVLAHPDHADTAGTAVMLGGPALYLAGVAGFKWISRGRRWPPLSHLAGLLMLAGLAIPAALHLLSALALVAATAAVLVAVAAWEHRSLRSAPRHGHAPAA